MHWIIFLLICTVLASEAKAAFQNSCNVMYRCNLRISVFILFNQLVILHSSNHPNMMANFLFTFVLGEIYIYIYIHILSIYIWNTLHLTTLPNRRPLTVMSQVLTPAATQGAWHGFWSRWVLYWLLMLPLCSLPAWQPCTSLLVSLITWLAKTACLHDQSKVVLTRFINASASNGKGVIPSGRFTGKVILQCKNSFTIQQGTVSTT